MLLLIIFSSFFVLLLPGAASPPPPAPSSSRDSSSPPALLPSFFTPSSPLLSPSFTVILLGRRERKGGGTKSGQGAPQRGREIPGLRGEKFSCRNSSQHGRRCLLLNPLSFAVPTQQPVPRAGGGKPPPNPPPNRPKRQPGSPGSPPAPSRRGSGRLWRRNRPAKLGRVEALDSRREERQPPSPAERSGAARPGRAGPAARPPSYPFGGSSGPGGLFLLLTMEPRRSDLPRGGGSCS